jgi:Uma2 family endonuclease
MSKSGLLTYDDLFSFPNDGLRRELIDGELIVSPSPRVRHQEIVGVLFNALWNHVHDHGGGRVFVAPLDVLLSDMNVLEPDIFFVAESQLEIITEPNIKGVPALVIEVLSDPRIDRVRKRDVYARFGVPEYWIVDPDADRVETYRLRGEAYGKPEILEPGEALTYEALPDFTIDLASLFSR